MIKKTDVILDAFNKYPEIASVLANAGLHCIGCHSSGSETIQEGCLAHGINEKDIDLIIKKVNNKIKEYDSKPTVNFTKKAIEKLSEKLRETNSKFIRINPVFGGVDFQTVNKKNSGDIEFNCLGTTFITDKKTERILRGININFSDKENDFVVD